MYFKEIHNVDDKILFQFSWFFKAQENTFDL